MKLTQTHAEILKFIIVGGINTLNYYVVYLLLLKLLHIEYMISHITGFLVAFVISYYLNCYFVYRVKPTWRKFISFPITQIVNVSLQTVFIICFCILAKFASGNCAICRFSDYDTHHICII